MAARPERVEDRAPRPPGGRDPMALDVVLTPMRRRHLRGVLRIEHQVYPRPWSLGLYMGELALPVTRVYIVARISSAVVGYAGLMIVGDEGHITTVAVEPAWHRNHIATRLMVCLTRQAVARSVGHLTLEVRMSNSGAQLMYSRFGFAPAGVRKGYYVDNAEDAMVMWAHDVHTAEHAARVAAIESTVPGTTTLEHFP